ncbi:MAG: FHA domain-containing protein [Clostridia bacterium]|nr:FHA domain-containing protein [Clostridia bacterium]
MSNEQNSGMTKGFFNPDAPTIDNNGGVGGMGYQTSEEQTPIQGFSPDMPTIDGDTKTYVPSSRNATRKPQQVNVTPDAPTEDELDNEPASPPQRVGSPQGFSIAGGGGNVPFIPMGQQRGNGGTGSVAPAAPFRPMGSSGPAGRNVGQVPGTSTGRNAVQSTGTGGWNAGAAGRSGGVQGQSAQPVRRDPPQQPVRREPQQQPIQRNVPQPPIQREPPRSGREPAYSQPTPPPPPKPSELPGQGIQSDHRSLTLKEMVSVEERRYSAEVQQYSENLARWKKHLWIPFVLLIAVAGAALLGGAFAGAVGVIFVLILAAATTGILTATGKLRGFLRPRKPKKNLPELDAPELTSVYTVKLRLKSTNLPKPVEITIRKEEQLLGCDSVLCIQPLPYKGISHRHCTIISKHQHGHTTYFVRDEGSKNGTKLNDRKLDPGIDYPLQIGDLITLAGRYQFKVLSDAY